MDFKKDKIFTAIIGAAAVVFVAGLAFSVVKTIGYNSEKTKLEKDLATLDKLSNRKKQFALTEENVVVGEANKRKLAVAKAQKKAELSGGNAEDFAPHVSSDPGEFSSSLRGFVNDLAKDFHDKKIALGEQAEGFGFSRYLQNSQTSRATPEALPILDSEIRVIRFLANSLAMARGESERALRGNGLLAPEKNVPLLVKAVRREAAEFEKREGAIGKTVAKDELVVVPMTDSDETGLQRLITSASPVGIAFPSLRRKDVVSALAFQIAFVAPTSVMRNFISQFSAERRFPVYVRDIAVVPANDVDSALARNERPTEQPESATTPADFDIFGSVASPESAAEGAGVPVAPTKIVVQPESLSGFIVTFEYVVPVEKKAEPAKEEEK